MSWFVLDDIETEYPDVYLFDTKEEAKRFRDKLMSDAGVGPEWALPVGEVSQPPDGWDEGRARRGR